MDEWSLRGFWLALAILVFALVLYLAGLAGVAAIGDMGGCK